MSRPQSSRGMPRSYLEVVPLGLQTPHECLDAHGALGAEHQPIVERARIIDAIFIDDQRVTPRNSGNVCQSRPLPEP